MFRRSFLKKSAVGTFAAVAALSRSRSYGLAPPSERIRVGCVGVGGRAASLLRVFAAHEHTEIVAITDVDQRRLPAAVRTVRQRSGRPPKVAKDFRELVDDASIDVLVVGTPDHWHAIPTISACLAGKDVYVEKPDGHNIVEGHRMVQAMRKHKRIVQLGTQARSATYMRQALDYVRSGRLGKVLVAKAWETSRQQSIGHPPDGQPPAQVDYDLWLGPAPKRPFNPRRFHGSWRWFFDYGTGDVGNDGVHRLDSALQALRAAADAQGESFAELPHKISAIGGKWYFDDMQQWPDTLQVTFEYPGTHGSPGRILTYEMRLWSPYRMHDETESAILYGDQGYLVISFRGWRAYDPKNELLAEGKSSPEDTAHHVANFLDCVKSRQRPNADLETVGHPSSVLCHAANIAWRVGRQVELVPGTETFRDDDQANSLRTRPAYRAPWTLPEV